MDKKLALILQIALDTPLRRVFDYLPPELPGADLSGAPRADSPAAPRADPLPGVRVRVPFGRQRLIGVLTAVVADSSVPASKLKAALEILDEQPVFDAVTFELLRWSARYYHHPLGEVIAAALPVSLREGAPAHDAVENWTLTAAGATELARPGARSAPRQRALLEWLAAHPAATTAQVTTAFKAALLKTVTRHGWAEGSRRPPVRQAFESRPSPVALTAPQGEVVEAVTASLGDFAAHVLYGVTGSGKTEVYLRVIAAAVSQGGQALVLVPEIALTPQLVERFQERFSSGVVVLHSALTGSQRRDAWRAAHGGIARIVIGTRSAIFTSMPELALIVVDEEHDPSYKQHEGFRYSARDLAVWRARRRRIPIVLGSATPSLETLENVQQGRYRQFLLPQRPGAAQPPRLSLVDLRRHASEQGLSQPVMQSMRRHLDAGGQIIVFLNRRGFAPTLFCNACGWVAPCARCDARMTVHRRAGELRCHHCGARGDVPPACAACHQPLQAVGQGTERVEETLARLYPDAPIARLDRDTAGAGRGALGAVLDEVRSGAARIVVGTQMLTKGHHFPDVSLVVILDADQGLFATDYRATERLAQTITQVAGRAGRAARAGEVLIQTEFPEHPLLRRLIDEGYASFATSALAERRAAGWPPFSRLALLRAEAKDSALLDGFLRAAAERGRTLAEPPLQILGPASALMARRADHFRAHLLVESAERPLLQRFLHPWLAALETLPKPPGLRWSIDVDPQEVD